MVKDVKVLGPGCPRCEMLYKNVEKALKELGITTKIEKITDIPKIVTYGIMSTPALVINEKVVSQGKILTVEEIKEIISKYE